MSYDALFRYFQDEDPGAVGPGIYWLDSTAEPYILKRRNEDDTDWVDIGASGSGITGIEIKLGGTTVDADVVVLDFNGADFAISESPENEANISFANTYALDIHTHDHLEITDWVEAVQDTLGATIAGDSTYITANYVDGSNALLIEHTGDHDDRYYTETEIDTTLGAIFIDVELVGRLDTNGSGASFTALAAGGSTGSIASSVGNDICGIIQLVPGGTGITSGSLVEVTFSNARPDTDYLVFFQELSSGAVTLGGMSPTSRNTTFFRLRTAAAPTSGTTYQWFYLVVGY